MSDPMRNAPPGMRIIPSVLELPRAVELPWAAGRPLIQTINQFPCRKDLCEADRRSSWTVVQFTEQKNETPSNARGDWGRGGGGCRLARVHEAGKPQWISGARQPVPPPHSCRLD